MRAQRRQGHDVKAAARDRSELGSEGIEGRVEPNLLRTRDDVVPHDDGDVGCSTTGRYRGSVPALRAGTPVNIKHTRAIEARSRLTIGERCCAREAHGPPEACAPHAAILDRRRLCRRVVAHDRAERTRCDRAPMSACARGRAGRRRDDFRHSATRPTASIWTTCVWPRPATRSS